MQQTTLDLGIDHEVEPFTMACNERPQARMENFVLIDCWNLTLIWFITPSAKAIFAAGVN